MFEIILKNVGRAYNCQMCKIFIIMLSGQLAGFPNYPYASERVGNVEMHISYTFRHIRSKENQLFVQCSTNYESAIILLMIYVQVMLIMVVVVLNNNVLLVV